MRWKYFVIILIAVLAAIIVAFWSQKTTEHALATELELLAADIDARGDGSVLRYDRPQIRGRSANIESLSYKNGASGAHLRITGLAGKARADRLDIDAAHIAITYPNGEVVEINDFSAENTRENASALGRFDRVSFDELRTGAVTVTGRIAGNLRSKMSMGAIEAERFADQQLERLEITDLSIGEHDLIAFESESVALSDLDYREIERVFTSINEGYLPLDFLNKIGFGSFAIEGLDIFMDGERIIENAESDDRQGELTEERMLDFFLKNAPQELRDLAGTEDGAELLERLDEFNDKPAEDQAIDALEFMLDFLKDQREEAAQ